MAFFRSTAYVRDPQRSTVAKRYMVPASTLRNVVDRQDTYGQLPLVGEYELKAPTGTLKIGEGEKRRSRLTTLRARGQAPAAIPRNKSSRRNIRARWNTTTSV